MNFMDNVPDLYIYLSSIETNGERESPGIHRNKLFDAKACIYLQ